MIYHSLASPSLSPAADVPASALIVATIMDTESQELLLRPLAAFLKTEASSTPPLLPSLPPSVSETDSVPEETISRRRRRRQTSPPPPPPQRFEHPEDIGLVREQWWGERGGDLVLLLVIQVITSRKHQEN